MRHRMQLSAAVLVLGASFSLGACAKGEREGTDTAVVGGAVTTTDTARRDTMAGPAVGRFDADHPRDDKERMMVVSQSNALEVVTSQIAVGKATNAAVKQFARDMVRDHGAMQKEGRPLGEQLGLPAPTADSTAEIAEEMRDKVEELRGKTGKDFDKEYMDVQVDAHQKTLDRLKDMQDDAQNAQLKSLITSAIPKVQAHLDRAKKLKDQVD